MKIKIIIGVLFLLLGICETQAQRLKNKDWKERKELAREQIKSLYEGVLVFRLKTRSKNIDALRLNGKNKLADKIQKRQDTLNHRIYKAFQTHFNFCRVEFFFSDQSQKFRDNQVDEVHFLNQNLSIDSTIKLNDQYFLTSDIGILEQDTSWVTGRRYLSENENGTEYASRYSGGTNMRFHALRVMSEHFYQLRRPFPYYVKTATFESLNRPRISMVVQKLNRRLKKYYQKVVRKGS